MFTIALKNDNPNDADHGAAGGIGFTISGEGV